MPHLPKPKKPIGITKRTPQGRRKQSNYEFYNSTRWRTVAKSYEAENPLCEQCKRNDKIVDATGRLGVTDHIYSVNKALSDYNEKKISFNRLQWYLYDEGNLQRMCNRCHNIKSGKEAHQ